MTDEVAIQQVISRYNEAASCAQWDEAVATYLPDGVWEFAKSGRRFQGRDAIREALIGFTSALEYVVQINAPAVIAVDGDQATARSAIRESGKFAGRDEGIEGFGIYGDRLVRTVDGWLFANRTFDLRWMHRVAILPAEAK
jgi:ketosteroid isomerase-like protein